MAEARFEDPDGNVREGIDRVIRGEGDLLKDIFHLTRYDTQDFITTTTPRASL